ncbi:hypothetical protein V6N13_048512 [Hibiscus sabdariffa]|uniref:Uncharacterized protein n=1 Tax=Hibiscus sabdariffa TaxID=183260 RepID=A0ABR2F7J5_9ROSI
MGQLGYRPRSWWEKALLFRGRRGDSRSSLQAKDCSSLPFHTPLRGKEKKASTVLSSPSRERSRAVQVSSIWLHGLYTSGWLHVVLSFILVIGFLHFIFNPSGFEWQNIVEDWDEWQKIVEDWDDWTKWISSHGGIGMPATKSWESWWAEEQEHLQYTGFMGQFREIVLSISAWSCVLFKIVFMGRKKFSADYQRMFRLLKLFLFIGFIVTLVILFLFLNLTVGDIFVNLLAFMPTGWAPLSVCSLYLSSEFGSSKSYLYASTPSSKQSFLKAKGSHSGFYLNNSYRICTLPLRSGMLISSNPLSMDFERTKRRLGGKETKTLNLYLSSSSRRARERERVDTQLTSPLKEGFDRIRRSWFFETRIRRSWECRLKVRARGSVDVQGGPAA